MSLGEAYVVIGGNTRPLEQSLMRAKTTVAQAGKEMAAQWSGSVNQGIKSVESNAVGLNKIFSELKKGAGWAAAIYVGLDMVNAGLALATGNGEKFVKVLENMPVIGHALQALKGIIEGVAEALGKETPAMKAAREAKESASNANIGMGLLSAQNRITRAGVGIGLSDEAKDIAQKKSQLIQSYSEEMGKLEEVRAEIMAEGNALQLAELEKLQKELAQTYQQLFNEVDLEPWKKKWKEHEKAVKDAKEKEERELKQLQESIKASTDDALVGLLAQAGVMKEWEGQLLRFKRQGAKDEDLQKMKEYLFAKDIVKSTQDKEKELREKEQNWFGSAERFAPQSFAMGGIRGFAESYGAMLRPVESKSKDMTNLIKQQVQYLKNIYSELKQQNKILN